MSFFSSNKTRKNKNKPRDLSIVKTQATCKRHYDRVFRAYSAYIKKEYAGVSKLKEFKTKFKASMHKINNRISKLKGINSKECRNYADILNNIDHHNKKFKKLKDVNRTFKNEMAYLKS
jgi:SMC interacting uncharacterized protein involved in chromosome segregation